MTLPGFTALRVFEVDLHVTGKYFIPCVAILVDRTDMEKPIGRLLPSALIEGDGTRAEIAADLNLIR